MGYSQVSIDGSSLVGFLGKKEVGEIGFLDLKN